MDQAREDRDRTVGAYVAGVVANAIVLFLVNKAPDWNLPFLTDDYVAALWTLNLSILVQIGGNAILIFFHPRFVHYLAQTAFNLFSLLALIILAAVFPFDFSFIAGVINTITRIALIAAAVGTAVSVVVNLLRAAGSLIRRHDR